MKICLYLGLFFRISVAEPLNRIEVPVADTPTRRILRGQPVPGDTRPYMVYLRPADTKAVDPNWLCGGVIIGPHHVLTSAACIADVKLFYIISGTSKYVPLSDKDNLCIKYGARKAVGKTVPQNYVYDGSDFNNIRWMANDIAVVKVGEDFNFAKRVKGCDFIPRAISFNNESLDFEKPHTEASVAGWGSNDKYNAPTSLNTVNSPILMEGKVTLISKKNCKKSWPERYHYIIDKYMICAADSADQDDTLCTGPECEDSDSTSEEHKENLEKTVRQRKSVRPRADTSNVNDTRRASYAFGGFCENDHGGPLVVGTGVRAVAAGVISACMTNDNTQKCHGPFLFTSVFHNSKLISCVLHDESVKACLDETGSARKSVETQYDWTHHDKGLITLSQTTTFTEQPGHEN